MIGPAVTEGAPSRKVLLVDDDPMMVRLVRKILADIGVTTIVHVTSGREALESLDGVDVVLLDHQLPDTTGLAVLDAIRARPHPPAIILVTAHGNESLAATALRQGADDYLAKDVSLNQLLPQVLERVRRIATGDEPDELAALTSQERKILALVAEGKTNKEIAAEVYLSDKTVKNYVSSILSKLNLERRAQAAAFVAKHRIDTGH